MTTDQGVLQQAPFHGFTIMKSLLIKIRSLLFFLLGYVIYLVSFAFPRSRKIWVFGSFGGAFNDNAKYLFIHVSKHCPEVQAFWISQNRATVRFIRDSGLNAYPITSLKGLYFALRARYWFFNAYTTDVLFYASGGATCVNLWHGVALKKIEFLISDGVLSNTYVKNEFKERFFHPHKFRRPDYILSPTSYQSVNLAKAFRISVGRCLEFGYPRNEILLADENQRQEFVRHFEPTETSDVILKLKKYQHTYIYLPTWRDTMQHAFADGLDLPQLNELMIQQNSLLVLKPHVNTVVNESDVLQYSNILFLNSSIDVYAVLPYTNTLITDYSSVLYDYILMDGKTVILYLYDFEKYLNERGFIYPYFEHVVGRITYNFSELYVCISQMDFAIDESKRQNIVRLFWGKGKLSRVCDSIAKNFLSDSV